jgi:hypothetical protein
MGVSRVTVHNSSKKLVQLNKVIECLTSVREDVLFKTAALRSHTDSRFQQLIQSHNEQMLQVYEGRPASSLVAESFTKQHMQISAKFNQQHKQITTKLQNGAHAISSDVSSCETSRLLIAESLRRTRDVLMRGNPFLSNLQQEVERRQRELQAAKTEVDAEFERKRIVLGQKQTARELELQELFERAKKELTAPALLARRTPGREKALKSLSDTRHAIDVAKKELRKRQQISGQNLHAFRIRVTSVCEELQNYQGQTSKDLCQFQSECEAQIRQFESELKQVNQDRARTLQRFSNEIAEHKDTQKIARAQANVKANQQRTRISRMSNSHELDDLQNCLAQEREDKVKQFSSEKSEVLEKLQNNKNDSRIRGLELDVQQLAAERIGLDDKHKNEIDQLNAAFTTEQMSLVIETEQMRAALRQRHKLLIILNGLRKIEALQPEEFPTPNSDEVRAQLDLIYETRLKESTREIEKVCVELQNDELEEERLLKQNHKEEIEQFGCDFRNESTVKELPGGYKLQFAQLNQQVSSIEIPTRNLATADDHYVELGVIKSKVKIERQQLLAEFESRMAALENQRPSVCDPMSEGHEVKLIELRNEGESRIGISDSEISRLTETLQDLSAFQVRQVQIPDRSQKDEKNLQLQLSQLEKQSKASVSREIRKTIEIIQKLRAELAKYSEAHHIEMEELCSQRQSDCRDFQLLLEAEANETSDRNAKHQTQHDSIESEFAEVKSSLIEAHQKIAKAAMSKIEAFRGDQTRDLAEEAILRTNALKAQVEELEQDLTAALELLLAKLREVRKQAQEEIDRARQAKLDAETNCPTGQDKQSQIDELETTLIEKNRLLVEAGHDFLEFREGLHCRDQEFSQRFGMRLNVGIVKHLFGHVVNRNWSLPIPKEAPPGLRKIISRCWSKNADDRPTFE